MKLLSILVALTISLKVFSLPPDLLSTILSLGNRSKIGKNFVSLEHRQHAFFDSFNRLVLKHDARILLKGTTGYGDGFRAFFVTGNDEAKEVRIFVLSRRDLSNRVRVLLDEAEDSIGFPAFRMQRSLTQRGDSGYSVAEVIISPRAVRDLDLAEFEHLLAGLLSPET